MANIRIEYVKLGNINPGEIISVSGVEIVASANTTDAKVANTAITSGLTARVTPAANAYITVTSNTSYVANSTNAVYVSGNTTALFRVSSGNFIAAILA